MVLTRNLEILNPVEGKDGRYSVDRDGNREGFRQVKFQFK